ncbi:MAG TPA: serine/threonine-protein kinase [Gemmatimonadaceae bacterium]|nr:serine/threonine-protein kinase [Gemmatimonadaceae bacterium]
MDHAATTSEFLALQQALAGRFSLDRELGRGGMGIVYLARDVALDRPVAIKLLPPALAEDAARRARFVREARIAASLSHPHIVPIHAVEERDDLVWFVMAFVDGETLGERVRRAGPLGSQEAARILREVAWALGHAHAHGTVHRDVKPDNILLERGTGRAMVTDFGIARAADDDAGEGTGQRAGTPQYMSPEQAAGEPADARSDLYSLGVTMYFALAGRLPFDGATAVALLAQHVGAPVPRLSEAPRAVPLALALAVERCLAKAPDERFARAEELIDAVAGVRDLRGEVPAPVRAFVREADGAGREIGTSLTAAASAQVVLLTAFSGAGLDDAVAVMVIQGAVVVMGGFALARVGVLMGSARDLVRSGFEHSGVRAALAMEERERTEEDALRRPSPRWETASLAAIGAAKTALAAWLVTSSTPWLYVPGLAGVIAIPTVTIRRLWSDLRRGPNRWHSAVAGPVGRWLFRIAGTGLRGRAATQPVAGEPTVVAVGNAVDSLFAALPADQRALVGDVPQVVRRLEAHALSLRTAGTGVESARQLETVVGALEALRLELLRLHAGGGSLEGLARDLDAARHIGRLVDSELQLRDYLGHRSEASVQPGS